MILTLIDSMTLHCRRCTPFYYYKGPGMPVKEKERRDKAGEERTGDILERRKRGETGKGR